MTPTNQKHFHFYQTKGRIYALGTQKTRFALTEFRRRFPGIFWALEPRLYLIGKEQGCVRLEMELDKVVRKLTRRDLKLTIDDHQIVEFCGLRAKSCSKTCARLGYTERSLNAVAGILGRYGLSLPDGKTTASTLKRTEDARWWRHQIRPMRARALDELAREYGLVSRQRGVYVSDWAFQIHQEQKARNDSLLAEIMAINDQGQEYTLKELADLSVSNPRNRRNELITRMAGLEAVANVNGDVGVFLTMTSPSKYHPVKVSGEPNPKYQGATARDTQAYLTATWQRIRSKFQREGIRPYGFRIVEPHHDGTPHWHMLLFVEPNSRERLVEIARTYALLEDGDEPGAQEARFEAVEIDHNKGSATGYIVKYICKNIDGDFKEDGHQAEDGYGYSTKNVAPRVTAWASVHQIRQFQQIGGPPVTVWRELRRLPGCDDAFVEQARLAADKGDFAAFTELMGGPTAKREDHPIKVARWIEFDSDTGEFLDSPVNEYGENAEGRIFGLFARGRHVITRQYRWAINLAKRVQPPKPKSSNSDWLANLKRLVSCRAATQEEIDAWPPDTAYAWEKLQAGRVLTSLEFCQ